MGSNKRPQASTPGVANRMARQPRRDTLAEMLLRRELHRLGLRYRVDAPIPGMPRRRADLTFRGARLQVFVDGCFWHGCPEHGTAPKSNSAWWAAKLARNILRDRETDEFLEETGWAVVRVWEHDDLAEAVARIVHAVTSTRLQAKLAATELRATAWLVRGMF